MFLGRDESCPLSQRKVFFLLKLWPQLFCYPCGLITILVLLHDISGSILIPFHDCALGIHLSGSITHCVNSWLSKLHDDSPQCCGPCVINRWVCAQSNNIPSYARIICLDNGWILCVVFLRGVFTKQFVCCCCTHLSVVSWNHTHPPLKRC